MGLTEKQLKILRKEYSEKQIAEMSYEDASNHIGKILASQGPTRKTIAEPKTEFVEGQKYKPNKFDATSSYTRQAADILIALINNQKDEPVEIGLLMNQAINCVDAARKRFE